MHIDQRMHANEADEAVRRAFEMIEIIPTELGGVPHPRNYLLVDYRAADAVATLPLAERLAFVRSIAGNETFDLARLFCKAVGDLTKTGVDADTAVKRVVTADPWPEAASGAALAPTSLA